jgi:uncharacterized protein YndB with AHSA1/START domain
MTELTLTKTILLKAPPFHVWKFLTQPDKLALWFHASKDELKAGSDYTMLTNSLGREGETLMWGKVLEADEPRKLVHTFTHPWINEVETVCTWTLQEVENGTLLTLIHSGWENISEDGFMKTAEHDKGWDQHFVRLRHVLS